MLRSIKFILALMLGLSFTLPLWAQKTKNYEKIFSMPEIERRASEKYIRQTELPTRRYQDDLIIQARDTVNYNILLNKGDLLIQGVVNGDVVVLFGDIRIESFAVVNGNVTAINGKIRQEAQSTVTGNQIETNLKNLFPAREFGKDYDEDILEKYLSRYTRPYGSGYSSLTVRSQKDSDLLFRYNRVQGVFLGVSIPKMLPRKQRYLSVYGFLGYGFSDQKTRYELAVDHWFFSPDTFRFELGAALYDKIESKDTWLISSLENTLAAFFLNDDYLDYYQRKGYELHASQNLTAHFKGLVAYRNDRYYSVVKTTDWALFKDDDRFPDNPQIDAGRMRSWYGELSWDTRNNPQLARNGSLVKLSVESSTKKMKSDFSFNQYIFEFRKYQRLGPWERLDVRLKAATSEGVVPLQKRFHLGGISTLRAFNYRSLNAGGFGGDRLLLLNLEYFINPRLFHFPVVFGDDFHYVVFFDMGHVWNRADVAQKDGWSEGFEHLQLKDFKSDLGIALTNASGRFRLNIAKRLDTSHKAWKVSFRINKPF
ncbi:polymer-forming cytoskeletal protein [Calditrichota bacterium GD2]